MTEHYFQFHHVDTNNHHRPPVVRHTNLYVGDAVSPLGHLQQRLCSCCRKYQVVFCYTIIERNNRYMLPVVRSSAGGDRLATNTNPLDSFFPYDPYLLKRYARGLVFILH